MNINGLSANHALTMRDRLQEQFSKADSDGNEMLSLSELSATKGASKLEQGKLAQAFKQADSNGDGQLTQDEFKQHADAVEQRMQQFTEGGIAGINSNASQSLNSLLAALSLEKGQEGNRQQLNNLAQKLQTEGATPQNVNDSMALLNKVAPPINTTA